MPVKKPRKKSIARQAAEKCSKRHKRKTCEYGPEYCDQLVEHMSQGYSFNSFAAKIGTSAQTLKRWRAQLYEFEEAAQVGEAASLLFWEQHVINHATRPTDGNSKMVELVMKCRFLWSDKQTIELTGALETQLRQLTDQQIETELRKLSARQNEIMVTSGEANTDAEIDAALNKLKG